MKIFLRISEYPNLMCFYLIKNSFDFSLKINFSQNWSCHKKLPIQHAGTASWKILVGTIQCIVGLCALSHQKLLRWWGELKIYLPRTHYQRSQELPPSRGLFANSRCYFSCWQLWERFYFRERTNSPVPQSFRLPRSCLLRPRWRSATVGLTVHNPWDRVWGWNLEQKSVILFFRWSRIY